MAIKKNTGVSVVICCYNSQDRIQETLRHLAVQNVPHDFSWEVILVDNNSSDETQAIAISCWEEMGNRTELKIVVEVTPGLNNARRRGFVISQYNYILFCDDDNLLDRDYVRLGFELLCQNKSIAVLGGVGVPKTAEKEMLPDWFGDFSSIYAVGKQANDSGEMPANRPFVYGAGMFLNKGFFSGFENYRFLTSDRLGDKLTSGGDYEICLVAIMSGGKVHWDEQLKFHHCIPKPRLTLNYVKKFMLHTAGSRFFFHGMMYKAKIDSQVYDRRIKRNWLIQIVLLIKNFQKTERRIVNTFGYAMHFRIQLIEIWTLIKMNWRYDKSFGNS